MNSDKKISANIGNKISCKGWQQEAALRMLQNNLDPNVAESPENLIVYGGYGKAARNWDSYSKIVDSLKDSKFNLFKLSTSNSLAFLIFKLIFI